MRDFPTFGSPTMPIESEFLARPKRAMTFESSSSFFPLGGIWQFQKLDPKLPPSKEFYDKPYSSSSAVAHQVGILPHKVNSSTTMNTSHEVFREILLIQVQQAPILGNLTLASVVITPQILVYLSTKQNSSRGRLTCRNLP